MAQEAPVRHCGIQEGFVQDTSVSLDPGGMSRYVNMQRWSGEALETHPEMGECGECEEEGLHCQSVKDPEWPHQEVLTVGL